MHIPKQPVGRYKSSYQRLSDLDRPRLRSKRQLPAPTAQSYYYFIQQLKPQIKINEGKIYYCHHFARYSLMFPTNFRIIYAQQNKQCIDFYNKSQVQMSNNYLQLVDRRQKRTFTQPHTVSRHLFCSICSDVFDDPVRTICGHTFCYICIENWVCIKAKCPVCNNIQIKKRKLQKDLLAGALVDELQVKCCHFGCNWVGVEAVRKKHQRTCNCKPPRETNLITNNVVELSDFDDVQEVSHFDLTSSDHPDLVIPPQE